MEAYVCLCACRTWHVSFPHTLRGHFGVEAVALCGDALEVVHGEMFAAQAYSTRGNGGEGAVMTVRSDSWGSSRGGAESEVDEL